MPALRCFRAANGGPARGWLPAALIIFALIPSLAVPCDFTRERSCDELSHEIGKVVEEMQGAQIRRASQTNYFKFRSLFDSPASLDKVEHYVTRVAPLMSGKLLQVNYSVAVCERGLDEGRVVLLAPQAGKFCGNDNSPECFRKFYAQAE